MSFMAGERRVARLAGFRARWYWLGTAGWVAWFVTPLGPGWLISKVFDELQRHGSSARFWWLLGADTAALVGASLLIMAAHRTYIQGVEAAKALARVNVVAAQLASGGAEAGPRTVPVGDALSRLRDDPHDVIFLLDNWVDLLGSLLYGVGAAVLLARIDPWATLAGIGPMILAGFANRQIGSFARRYRQRSRDASSAVGDFLTASITASLTVKVAGAQPDVLRRLDELNAQRAKTAVLDQTWGEVVWTLNSALADAFVGVALVVAARRGLTVGQITLFASYLTGLVWLPMRLGGVVIGRRRYQVSAGRLDALLAPSANGVDRLIERRALPILHGPPAERPTLGPRRPLVRLDVQGLTLAARGLADINFTIERGSLVVVSGPVGSGKTSLLRALIGLLSIDEGSVLWNGEPVQDRAAFFTPPQCAYVSQVPRLFAESLADNLRLGHTLSDDDVHNAIELAAFERDVADLPSGLDTLVGARGVRLSGGQAQRAAAARALAHRPELLVLDDLTSALDVETELALWDRLAAAGFTVLAASNRPVALARADQVIRLEIAERVAPTEGASIAVA
jgi:ATP-binding cassette, subfamily B, bacterial